MGPNLSTATLSSSIIQHRSVCDCVAPLQHLIATQQSRLSIEEPLLNPYNTTAHTQHKPARPHSNLVFNGGSQNLSDALLDQRSHDRDRTYSTEGATVSGMEEEVPRLVMANAMTDTETLPGITITSVPENATADPGSSAPPGDTDDESIVPKEFTDEEDKAYWEHESYQDILSLLSRRSTEFYWDSDTCLVGAFLPSHWERLKTQGDGHLLKYRTHPFPQFLKLHQGSNVPLVPHPQSSKTYVMHFRDKARLEFQHKGIKLLQLAQWDSKDDPWARKHFFDVYMMMKNTIEMGYLTWNKKKCMLWGDDGMWEMHQCDQLKTWKGVAFPDFHSWAYILNMPVDIMKFAEHEVLAPNVYKTFYKTINGTAKELKRVPHAQAPLVFGLGTTNKTAKRMVDAIQQYKWETYQVYMTLLHPEVDFHPTSNTLHGTDTAWQAISHDQMQNNVGFDGAIWRDKETTLFLRGLYYFEDSIADLVENMLRDAKAAAAERLLTDPKFAKKVKENQKEMERLKKETKYYQSRAEYQEKKLDKLKQGGSTLFPANEPLADRTKCCSESCAICSSCYLCLKRVSEIKERESKNYAGLPITPLQIDLLFEQTAPRTLKVILDEFKLLQGFENNVNIRSLAQFDPFKTKPRAEEAGIGVKILRPTMYKLQHRPSPFRLGSGIYYADSDLGCGIFVLESDFAEVHNKGHIPSLRKMVQFAGEKGKAEILNYFGILAIDVEDRAEPEYYRFLSELKPLTERDRERYGLEDNKLFSCDDDLSLGIFLAGDDVPEDVIPGIRNFVMENGPGGREKSIKRLKRAGIEVVDRLGVEEKKALREMLRNPQTEFERGVVAQMKALDMLDRSIEHLEALDAEEAQKDKAAKDLDIKDRLDLGFGIRLKEKAPGYRLDKKWRNRMRAVVKKNGPGEGRATSLAMLEVKGVEVVDMLGERVGDVCSR